MFDEIATLETGDTLEQPVLLEELDDRTTDDGRPYFAGHVRDRSGSIAFRFWNCETFRGDPGDVVLVDGVVDEYEGTRQLNLNYSAPHGEWNGHRIEELEPARFCSGPDNPEALLEDLLYRVQTAAGATVEITRTVYRIVGAKPHESGIERLDVGLDVDKLLAAPAAKRMHHAYPGGLLVHTRSMTRIAEWCMDHYPTEIRDEIVIPAIVLHDLGKVRELSGPHGTRYTTEGELVGHIPMIHHEIRASDLEERTRRHLEHAVLSHHGRRSWGSPVEPKTPEAHLVHQIDNLDSTLAPILDTAAEARTGAAPDGWHRAELPTGDDLLVEPLDTPKGDA